MKLILPVMLIALLTSCAPHNHLHSTAIVKNDYPTPFEFELIDTVTGSKDQIYVKAHEWISKSFKSAKAVIDMQDKEAGKLIGKSFIPVFFYQSTILGPASYPGEVTYVMTIDCKDGKYRCVISGFNHTSQATFSDGHKYEVKDYGNMQADSIVYKSPITYKMVADKEYYRVKNQVMDYCTATLDELREAMHKPDKDF